MEERSYIADEGWRQGTSSKATGVVKWEKRGTEALDRLYVKSSPQDMLIDKGKGSGLMFQLGELLCKTQRTQCFPLSHGSAPAFLHDLNQAFPCSPLSAYLYTHMCHLKLIRPLLWARRKENFEYDSCWENTNFDCTFLLSKGLSFLDLE